MASDKRRLRQTAGWSRNAVAELLLLLIVTGTSFVGGKNDPSSHLTYQNLVHKKQHTRTKSTTKTVHHTATCCPLRPRRDFCRGGSNDAVARKKNFMRDYGKWIKREVQKSTGSMFAVFGFISSTCTEAVCDQTLFRRKWRPTVRSFQQYLKISGIDVELSKSLNVRLVSNLIILGRVQQFLINGMDRRDEAAMRPFQRHLVSKHGSPDMEEAARYMRFATAVYGTDMIRAAEADAHAKYDKRVMPLTRDKISEHIGVPQDDIVLMNVNYGGSASSDFLRHFLAIDHKHKAVVLAIRGSFSVSDIVVDSAAFSRPFCGGEAHSEMANQAERVWSVAGGTVQKALRRNKGYEFVVTGHSLGAGTASLVNVLCHSRRLAPAKRMRCFCFASPPVFSPLEVVAGAVSSSTNYIHENDAVPFLSTDSVRRLFACIRAVEVQTRQLGLVARSRLVFGRTLPQPPLVDAVVRAAGTTPLPKAGAPILAIPAATNVWLKQDNKGQFDAKLCDSKRLASLGIFVHPNMIVDHAPPRYEHAFQSYLQQRQRPSR